MIGRCALDGKREDVASATLRFALRLFLDGAHHLGHLVAHLVLGLLEEHLARLGHAQAGDALECGHLLRADGVQLFL